VTVYAPRPVTRVFGIDPGLTRCGLGIVEGVPGRPPAMVAVGVVRTGADEHIAARLLAIEEEIEHWLTEYQPDAVAVERVFSQHNVRTVMGTAQAGAVAIVCAARRGLPVALHTPSEVKAAVTGSGRADKEQVTVMVMRLLRMTDRPRPADAADALALAICHLWRAPAVKARRTAAGTGAIGTGPMTAGSMTAGPMTAGPMTAGSMRTGTASAPPASESPVAAAPVVGGTV
jgi:crossover junction endodeoxyribonuclease RuvC